MKIEQLLGQYLYINKKMTLQGVGSFYLNPSVSIPEENDKDFNIPDNAISFEYNLRAPEDDGLIEYIVKQTGKIKPLASADLDSFILLSKQFLNIGKPLTIEGVGTIQKNQQGEYFFTAGQFITPRIDDIPKQLREKRDESVSFESEARPDNRKRNLIVGFGIFFLIIAGLGIYYLFFYQSKIQTENIVSVEQQPVQTIDTAKIDTAKIVIPDSALAAAKKVIDSSSFKVVIKSYPNKDAAEKAYNKLTLYGHKLEMITSDSVTYLLVMPFRSALADTTRTRDSLSRFFGTKTYIIHK